MTETRTELIEANAEGAAGIDALAWVMRLTELELPVAAWFYDTAIKPVGVDRWLADIEAREEHHREILREEIHALVGRMQSLPKARLMRCLRTAHKPNLNPVEVQTVDEPITDSTPHWSSGCDAIDRVLAGKGFYGCNTIVGEQKTGKSLLAIGAAVEAARAGWRVLYVNAEMSRGHIAERFYRYMNGKPDPIVAEQLQILNVGPGFSIDVFIEKAEELLEYEDRRLMFVLDSLNRMIDFDTEGGGYFESMKRWVLFSMAARKESDGAISSVIVSELGRNGKSKGDQLEYACDTVITLKSTGEKGLVELQVAASRATDAGNPEMLHRNFATGRFEDMT
jgi:KaiC/GvpD/RAD55 family RecA-like ATPase